MNIDDFHWDDVRLFLACARTRSFRRAGAELDMDPTTIARRIDRFEKTIGAAVFARLPSGLEINPHGLAILRQAETFELGAIGISRAVRDLGRAERVAVKLSMTEGLGTFWVTPRLIALQQQRPDIQLELRLAEDSADVLRLEADISIQFLRPAAQDLICARIGRLHIYFYAAPSYLARRGRPKSLADLSTHNVVDQIGPQLEEGVLASVLKARGLDPDQMITLRTNSSTAHFYAVEKGAGVGGLATYASALGAQVEPLDLGVKHQLDIWMVYHPSLRTSPHAMAVADWARSVFNPRRYPWFGDAFIHPSELKKLDPSDWMQNMVGRSPIAAAKSEAPAERPPARADSSGADNDGDPPDPSAFAPKPKQGLS